MNHRNANQCESPSVHHAELVTKDQAIRDADVIATIW